MTNFSFRGAPISTRFASFLFAAIAVFFASEMRGQSLRTIVIDPGHGGYDRGGVPGQRISEKDKTLDVARRLRRVLDDAGYRTVMTRNSDDFVSLGQRVALANSYRNATFVSVHFNCAPRLGANGIETYYYSRDSASLAAGVHRNVVASAPTENRGIRRRGFFVLRKSANPSVLVECGFLTNPTEGALAQRPDYRQKLAEAIARGIQRQPAGRVRPLSREAAVSSEVLPQPFNGGDFVRAVPATRHSLSSSRHRSSKSSKLSKASHHRKKKKTSSEDDSSSTRNKTKTNTSES
ncbi:MAG: N-acetylmuramoyl-L-alanine amidase [Chthoniobacterales bacterium]